MISYRMLAIVKREIKAPIFTKKFIFMTLSVPLIFAIIIAVQIFLVNYQEDDKSFITVITESTAFQSELQARFQDSDLSDDSFFQLTYLNASDTEMETYIEDNRQAILDNKITGVLFIPDSAREDKQVTYYSANPSNQTLLSKFRAEINKAVIEQYFNERDIDQASIDYARKNVNVDGIRVTTEGTTDESPVNFIIAAVLTMFLYMSLLISGPIVMGVVNEEKTNRVVEVLLSSVTSNELMTGKVIGTAVAFLAQMLIWLLPLILLSVGSLPMLAALTDMEINIELFNLIYFLINYFLGLLIYLSIFSVFGAIFDNPQEAQSSMLPVIMLVMIPLFIATTMGQNPANFIAEVSSMLPFSSIMVMPARMTLIAVPLWQIGLAFAVNLVTFYFVIKLAGKLYRITILITGKRPSWKEMYKWLRYS